MAGRRVAEARTILASRLRKRRTEIEQAIQTRIYDISDPTEGFDPEYLEGLRAALGAALDYGLAAVEGDEQRAPPPPAILLDQARVAARSSVSLDTVLRRYFAGYTLLGDFLIEEAERVELLEHASLKRLLNTQAAIFDSLIAAVTEEHRSEVNAGRNSAEKRRVNLVRKLLAGELLDRTGLSYEFDAHHLGLVAGGPGVPEMLRHLAAVHGYQLLLVVPEDGIGWAWFASHGDISSREISGVNSGNPPSGVTLAVGEPGEGLAGWRLSHRQALAAMTVARRRPEGVVRYADVALHAAVLRDDLLAASLRKLYLDPLSDERGDGHSFKATLRAYFEAGRNVSSAAAALGVDRHTVSGHIRAVEDRVGRSLSSCAPEMDVALRLELLDGPDRGQARLETEFS